MGCQETLKEGRAFRGRINGGGRVRRRPHILARVEINIMKVLESVGYWRSG